MTGEMLDAREVRKARREEIGCIAKMKVWAENIKKRSDQVRMEGDSDEMGGC